MATLKKGDDFPEGVNFSYIPYTPEKSGINTCGIVSNYEASKGNYIKNNLLEKTANPPLPEFAGKKIVLVSVPGAFTGTCSEKHLPGYIQNVGKFKEKGVDKIVVIAYNDAWYVCDHDMTVFMLCRFC
jgi:alkyl hydroperoxide reductase 1